MEGNNTKKIGRNNENNDIYFFCVSFDLSLVVFYLMMLKRLPSSFVKKLKRALAWEFVLFTKSKPS